MTHCWLTVVMFLCSRAERLTLCLQNTPTAASSNWAPTLTDSADGQMFRWERTGAEGHLAADQTVLSDSCCCWILRWLHVNKQCEGLQQRCDFKSTWRESDYPVCSLPDLSLHFAAATIKHTCGWRLRTRAAISSLNTPTIPLLLLPPRSSQS